MPTQAEIDHDYKRLKVLLEDTDDAVIAFILYRDIKEQRENAAKLRDLINLPVTEVALKGDNLNPVRTFLSLPKEPRQALFFTFLGSSLPEGKSDFDKFAGYVNIQREAFTDAPHAVVLWLREEQLVRLMRRAPDFWAWRSGVFDVRGELQPDTSAYRELEEVDAFERGELEHQVALYREILKGQLEREEPDLAYVARTRMRLSDTLGRIGLYEEMAIEAQEIIELSAELENTELRVLGLNQLAAAYIRLNDYEKAEPLCRESLALTEEIVGKESHAYAIRLNNLAWLLTATGRYSEAEPMYREVIEIGARTLGKEHPDYATWLNGLAMLLEDTNRPLEAEALYREALEINKSTVGIEHPNYASELINLARLLGHRGRFSESEQLYREAIDLKRRTLGKEHYSYANSLNSLAELLAEIGHYEEAEPLYREAIGIMARNLGREHPNYANRLSKFALLLANMERYEEAEPLYREALEKAEKMLGKAHPIYARTLYNLAGLLIETKRYSEARTSCHEALNIFTDIFGEDHPNTRLVAENYELLLQKLEQQTSSPASG